MQIDTNKIKKFLNLSDEEFKRRISETAKTSGLENEKMNQMLKDVKNLKQTLSAINEQDLVNAVNAFGSEKLEAVIKNMQAQNKR
jgi:hypothetical protein